MVTEDIVGLYRAAYWLSVTSNSIQPMMTHWYCASACSHIHILYKLLSIFHASLVPCQSGPKPGWEEVVILPSPRGYIPLVILIPTTISHTITGYYRWGGAVR